MTRPGPSRWFFDAWSRFYDWAPVQRAIYRPIHDVVLRELAARHCRAPVDVGCGTGLLTTRVAETLPAARVVGLDFSHGMLRHARARDPRPSWVVGDAQRLPLASQRFDAVISTESFHWFPDQEAALAEFFRILVPGGWLFVGLVNPPLEAVSRLARRVSVLAGQPLHWPTRSWLRARLVAAGFEVCDQRWMPRLPALLLPAVLTTARRPPESRPG